MSQENSTVNNPETNETEPDKNALPTELVMLLLRRQSKNLPGVPKGTHLTETGLIINVAAQTIVHWDNIRMEEVRPNYANLQPAYIVPVTFSTKDGRIIEHYYSIYDDGTGTGAIVNPYFIDQHKDYDNLPVCPVEFDNENVMSTGEWGEIIYHIYCFNKKEPTKPSVQWSKAEIIENNIYIPVTYFEGDKTSGFKEINLYMHHVQITDTGLKYCGLVYNPSSY